MGIMRNFSTDLVVVLCLTSVFCTVSGGVIAGIVGLGGGDEAVFNVLQFGAKPGDSEPSTMAFVRTWIAACNSVKKAKVLVPPGIYVLGETVFGGPCKSPAPVTIQVTGTLKALADLSEYSGSGWISFEHIDGLIVTGGGTFDGQGPEFWKYNDCETNPECVHLPAGLHFNYVKNAKIQGIKIVNSMGFHMHVTNCNVFKAHRLHITAPETSPNTDGMHISKSQTVKVSRSVIGTGDDCISIGQGSTNVSINKIKCGPGHGISVGSLGKLPDEQDVRGLIVKNCTLSGTTNGIRIKTWAASAPSKASGMLFTDIVFDDVKNPIIIDQSYGSDSNKPSLVKISDVVFQNIRGTTITPNAVNLMRSSQVPCERVRFNNINLKSKVNNDSYVVDVVVLSRYSISKHFGSLVRKLNGWRSTRKKSRSFYLYCF